MSACWDEMPVGQPQLEKFDGVSYAEEAENEVGSEGYVVFEGCTAERLRRGKEIDK